MKTLLVLCFVIAASGFDGADRASAACTPAPSGLVSWWPAEENGADIIGTNVGTLEGMTFAVGEVGQAFSLNGSGSDVLLAASPTLQFTNKFTIEAWINAGDVNNYRQIFSQMRDLPTQSWHYNFGLAPSGALRLEVSGDNVTYDFLVSPNGVLSTGLWAHVVATFDSGACKLYVNGSLVASKTSSVTSIYYGTSTTTLIGCTPQGNQRFLGLIDEMSVYNRALSASEIQAIYNASASGKCSPPAVSTLPVSRVTGTGATLNGNVNPKGLATTAWFEWGLTTNYGNATARTSVGAADPTNTSATVTGLTPTIAYHFRAAASNSVAVVYGTDTSFVAGNVVTTLADSGLGSLRDTIPHAATNATITFNVTGIITNLTGELFIANNVAINGPGQANLSISGNQLSRVFNIASGATVNMSGLTVRDGLSASGVVGSTNVPGTDAAPGGGIYNAGTLTLMNCTVTSCRTGGGGHGYDASSGTGSSGGNGGDGAGMYNAAGATLTINQCAIIANANGSGGSGGQSGALNPGGAGGSGGNGGGIFNAGTMSAVGCSFVANAGGRGATGGTTLNVDPGSGFPGGNGGDGGSGGCVNNTGNLIMKLCTLASGAAGAGGRGGEGGSAPVATGGSGGTGGNGGAGAGLAGIGAFTLIACTISGCISGTAGQGGTGGFGALDGPDGPDGSDGNGGGLINTGVGLSATLRNTLVAGNSAGQGVGTDLYGAFNTQGHNLIGVSDGSPSLTNGANSDLVGSAAAPLNPGLAQDVSFSGQVPTYPLVAGSPAIDAGDDALLGPPFNLTTDQRGVSRKIGAHVDIGAYEFLPGDLNGDGVVDQGELRTVLANYAGVIDQSLLNTVLSNYYSTSPWLYLTNVAGLGGTNVTFALTNSTEGAYSVLYSTNLVNWSFLGPAIPRFEFTDTNAPAAPRRFYRLRWP
jgi:hypothetical protein